MKIRKPIENGVLRASRFKLNKQFNPTPADEGDEVFANGIFVFNVTKLMAFIKANPDQFPIEKVEIEPFVSFSPERLNEDTIRTANPSVPIILAEIAPGRYNVIDGHHRVEKARRDGLKKIPAYRVFAAQHFSFLTSVNAYRTYVEYWNSKIGEAA